MTNWRFAIDVGGTFTDVVAYTPGGTLRTHKLLSSGAVRGQAFVSSDGLQLTDPVRTSDPPLVWVGYQIDTSPLHHINKSPNQVSNFDSHTGTFQLANPLTTPQVDYQLRSHEPAPVVAIRFLMGLKLADPIPAVEVRLGTTRGTNALLERKGARTAFVTTKGFADLLEIGYQDRPDLFQINIRKRDRLVECSIEIDERMTAQGDSLKSPDERRVKAQLEQVRESGIAALAVCLLHSHVNPAHEELIAQVANSVGFEHISLSSRVARLEKIVPRGDTTVVDAYLGSVIRDYVGSLRRCMPQARIRLMTSNGGLVDADRVLAKDTILSGPAGGAVGCAQVSRAAGLPAAIGFDMGGTSTDVVRIEPPPAPFEYQHETVKAGIRIMAPMLAVETVAAGGGSICGFDGQKLTVGPHSAGADPGPACYGRGGPLTVTDMNLFLGRISSDHFPFPLDRKVVEEKLKALCDQIFESIQSQLHPIELASGFIEIANHHMATAIRKISIARGYDPAQYTLATFGGAGAQHACAIAELLGMSRVLCSPYAGVLSALGIAAAPIKRVRERSVKESLSQAALDNLSHLGTQIENELRSELVEEHIDADVLQVSRSFDVCYAGQATLLSVAAGSAPDMRADFEKQHRQLYGYDHPNRDVEIRIVRVEVATPHTATASPPTFGFATKRQVNSRNNEGPATRTMVVKGQPCDVSLLTRDSLVPQAAVAGPAIIAEQTSTIVVDPGWQAVLLLTNDILLERGALANAKPIDNPKSQSETQTPARRGTIDNAPSPIRLELFNNQFAAIAEQMGVTLRRTALSTNVKERLDFSCALFTGAGDLVVNAPHIPVHLGGMSECVKCLIEDVENFSPGDVYITNDPFRGGSHLNDITVVTPVFAENDLDNTTSLDHCSTTPLRPGQKHSPVKKLPNYQITKLPDFFVASRAHHAEIGGIRPGSMPPESKNLAEEGVLIRSFRWMKDGKAQVEELRSLLTAPPYPSRSPDDNLADIAAQVAANQTGVTALLAMVAYHGMDVVRAYMSHIQTAAENKMRAALRKLPNGVRRFEDRMDDGTTIRLIVTIEDGTIAFDFSGTDPTHPGNFNANRAIVTSAILYCMRCLIDEDIPLNGGVLAPVTIHVPPCFLNPVGNPDSRKCPAVAAGNVETSQRIVDVIFGALGMVAASQGTMNNLLMGNARFGYYETICGGAGAGPNFHGADAVHTNMTNTRLTDPETLESRYPVRLNRFQIRPGSGGLGQYRGGCGVAREFEFLEPLDVSLITQRRLTAPYGLRDGDAGQPGRNVLIRAPIRSIDNRQSQSEAQIPARREQIDNPMVLGPVASFSAQPGDRLIIETPGGGGWGANVE